MIATGWIGEEPAAAPAMPVTAMMLGMKQRGAGDTLARALARGEAADAREAREAAASAPDPDERAAGLVTRGYSPGLLNELSQRLADVTAEAEAEREKIEKAARRAEHVRRAYEAGRIRAWDIPDALGDEGDVQRAEQLERRAGRLRAQIAETMKMIAPPQRRDLDPLEAATARAHQAFRETTRAMMEEAQERRPERRPFDSAGPGAVTEPGPDAELARLLGPPDTCRHCANLGATPAQRAAIHAGV